MNASIILWSFAITLYAYIGYAIAKASGQPTHTRRIFLGVFWVPLVIWGMFIIRSEKKDS